MAYMHTYWMFMVKKILTFPSLGSCIMECVIVLCGSVITSKYVVGDCSKDSCNALPL